MDWGVAEVFKIIALYRQYPCLWEYRSQEYKRIDLKKNAWEEISKEMGKTVEEVKKKIKYLRSAYVGEKKKVEGSKSSGSATDDVYRPHLFYFDEFSFLDSVVLLRKTTSNLPKESSVAVEVSPEQFSELSQDCSQDSSYSSCSVANSTPENKYFKGAKRAKMDRNNKYNEVLDTILTKVKETSVQSQETMFSSFATSIALQLAQLPIVVATQKMAEIQKLIADAVEINHTPRTNILEEAMFEADINQY